MFSRDIYFLAVLLNIRINARLEWWHHPSKYWFSHAFVSAILLGGTVAFSLANRKRTCHCVNVDLAIKISSSIGASPKAARSVIHQRKLATYRCHFASLSTMFNCAMIDMRRLRIVRSIARIHYITIILSSDNYIFSLVHNPDMILYINCICYIIENKISEPWLFWTREARKLSISWRTITRS